MSPVLRLDGRCARQVFLQLSHVFFSLFVPSRVYPNAARRVSFYSHTSPPPPCLHSSCHPAKLKTVWLHSDTLKVVSVSRASTPQGLVPLVLSEESFDKQIQDYVQEQKAIQKGNSS